MNCEFRFHGESYGWEAQILREGEFVIGQPVRVATDGRGIGGSRAERDREGRRAISLELAHARRSTDAAHIAGEVRMLGWIHSAVRDAVAGPSRSRHWNRVQWVPFVTPPVRVVDVLVNTALYVPFGYWFLEASTRRRRTWQVLALAAALSAGTEWSQVYSHSRYPSMTDLTCNVVGAWYGARWLLAQKP
jgi:hypothetical protein